MASVKIPRVLLDLQEINPGLEVKTGGKHLKLVFRGRFIGIYPVTPGKEGLALNTKSQLRRAGVRLQ